MNIIHEYLNIIHIHEYEYYSPWQNLNIIYIHEYEYYS